MKTPTLDSPRQFAEATEETQTFGQTRRYHTKLCLIPQDVAQHSYGVAWLCILLTGGQPSSELLQAALAHDAGEQVTGDVPAPTKRNVPGLNTKLEAMEYEYLRSYGLELPQLRGQDELVLKLADNLEGAFYTRRERYMGNKTMVATHQRYLSYCKELLAQIRNAGYDDVYERGSVILTQASLPWRYLDASSQ